MRHIVQILLAIAMLAIVTALLVTSVGSHSLHGSQLMAHMFASGVLVVVLPLFAIAWLWQMYGTVKGGTLLRVGYWTVLLTGFATTGTMFLSMLPIAGTQHLTQLILIHGYAGFAMVAAAVLFAIGWLLTRRASVQSPK